MRVVKSEKGVAIKESNHKRTAVVGIGNVLLKDEGIGVHVARALREVVQTDEANLDVIDGGTSPDAFLLLEGIHKLVLVDAVNGGGNPGSVYRFHPDDIVFKRTFTVSAHQIGLLDSLQMMKFSANKPEEVVIIGVEPKEIGWGMELSAELRGKLHQIIKVVMNELNSEV
ncbi:HyaD/HybD family hydrogenase maturation endopeptidase [Chloroflexota bacterium]